MRGGALALMGLGLLWVAPAQATVFRKCTFKVVVEGEGLPKTEVEGAQFTAWGRWPSHPTSDTKAEASRMVNRDADACAKAAFDRRDHAQVTPACRDNGQVHGKKSPESGITGFTLTRPFSRLKQTICKAHRSTSRVRTMTDDRTIQSFRVRLEKVSGTGRCRARDILGPAELKISCRGKGKDKDWQWFYTP